MKITSLLLLLALAACSSPTKTEKRRIDTPQRLSVEYEIPRKEICPPGAVAFLGSCGTEPRREGEILYVLFRFNWSPVPYAKEYSLVAEDAHVIDITSSTYLRVTIPIEMGSSRDISFSVTAYPADPTVFDPSLPKTVKVTVKEGD